LHHAGSRLPIGAVVAEAEQPPSRKSSHQQKVNFMDIQEGGNTVNQVKKTFNLAARRQIDGWIYGNEVRTCFW
jgi:hypothetical protein